MIKRKSEKERGKLKLSKYFQEFKEGDKVAVIRDHAMNPAFPKRIQGRTGNISESRGNAYLMKLNEGKMVKTHIIRPIHLKILKMLIFTMP